MKATSSDDLQSHPVVAMTDQKASKYYAAEEEQQMKKVST
jgi:hypothetical protein